MIKRRIGGHVSSAGGFLAALDRAQAIGANTIQIFGASPVQWRAELPVKEDTDAFKKECTMRDITPIFLHAPYLINLASPKGELAAMSRTLLQKHTAIAAVLGARGVIFHIGSRGERPKDEARDMVVRALRAILDNTEEGNVIIENNAGAGNLVGDTIEEIASIYKEVHSERVGVCIDTAHAFESGLLSDFSDSAIDVFIKKINHELGKDALWAVHLNDSKTPAGSKRDRHENIGEGCIGAKGLARFINHPALRQVPLILEVPGFDGKGPDKKNIERVRSLIKPT